MRSGHSGAAGDAIMARRMQRHLEKQDPVLPLSDWLDMVTENILRHYRNPNALQN
jgi:hypothetical protein